MRQLFDKKFEQRKGTDGKSLLANISLLSAVDIAIASVRSEGAKYPNPYKVQMQESKSSIVWRGKNEIDFTQLVYALHEVGILTNTENEITTLVKQVAKSFNLELGKNWQSNLSTTINSFTK